MSKRHSHHSHHSRPSRSSRHRRRSTTPSPPPSYGANDNVISLPPPEGTLASRSGKRGLIYFIPGNPGFVEYYRDFLTALRAVVDSSETQYHGRSLASLHIYGRDLCGFQDDERFPASVENPPLDVQGQVDAAMGILERLCVKGVGDHNDDGHHDGNDGDDDYYYYRRRGFDFVILMGHSVGGYIATSLVDQYGSTLPIRHAVLLFPTIFHIAKSPRGKAATPLLNAISPKMAARTVRVAMWPWPRGLLRWTLGRMLGMEERAAAVTERFLKSRDGVFKALWLARDEMRVIGEDRWGDSFWKRRGAKRERRDRSEDEGSSGRRRSRTSKIPRFFMFFGEPDGWVDGPMRDQFIARTRNMGGVKAVVDGHGLPHSFCTHEFHSVMVAALIKDWIRDIQDGLVDDSAPDSSPEIIVVEEEGKVEALSYGSSSAAHGSSSTAPTEGGKKARLFGWW